jgi:hypothetical protein
MSLPRSSEATPPQIISLSVQGQVSMSDDPKDVVEAAIRSAFVSYPREDEPDWRSPHWIRPEECAHLAKVVIRQLETKGFQIVKKATWRPSTCMVATGRQAHALGRKAEPASAAQRRLRWLK